MTSWTAIDDPLPGHRRHGDGPTVVLLHGFTQTGLSWTPVTGALDPRFDLVAPDAPGHGRSSHHRSSITEYADRLALSLPPSVYVGYSMGGRTALHVAIRHPSRVRALVLIGATPGIDDPQERAVRRASDEALARHLLDTALDEFLVEWLSQPLFATLPPEARDLDDRRGNDRDGLASSLRMAGTGSQESLWSRLSEITCPTILITGALDSKFTDIAVQMAAAIGGPVEHLVIAGRGHAVHLEAPSETARTIADAVARSI